MKKVVLNDVEPSIFNEGSSRRGLSDPLGTTNIAINYYRLAPGEGFPGGLHTHMGQEEVFVILEGEATFETMDGEVTVDEREAIRFAPGDFQSGKNDSEAELVVLAMGTPRDTEDVRVPIDCPECNQNNMRLDIRGNDVKFVCPDCDTEQTPEACPECGRDDLSITLGEETQTVVICQECGAEFRDPPLQDSR